MTVKTQKTTEQDSLYRDLEKMSISKLISIMNLEDQKVAVAVSKSLKNINRLIKAAADCVKIGGRIIYIGAGTSGRLGVLDASEIPPTFGTKKNLFIGLIAGGNKALRNAVEFAEDSTVQGWLDVKKIKITKKDFVIGISANGSANYVVSTLKKCVEHNILTGCITCNKNTELARICHYPISVIVGPEVLTGSTRLKSGTATKMILNMISTTIMIQMGKVQDNKMVNMQLTNKKLIDRGTRMIQAEFKKSYQESQDLLLKYGSVKNVFSYLKNLL